MPTAGAVAQAVASIVTKRAMVTGAAFMALMRPGIR
jgi:hypothetical protein